MTRKQLEKCVAGFGYKPGWKFSVKDKSQSSVYIHLRARVLDAYGKKKYEYIEFNRALPLYSASVYLIRILVQDIIDDAEAHEFAEWFKYKGRRLYDPHR